MNRRSFFRSIAKTVTIVALAPQLAFRTRPLQIEIPPPQLVENVHPFDRWIFPIIKAMNDGISPADLVKTQPMMALPTAEVFYMDMKR